MHGFRRILVRVGGGAGAGSGTAIPGALERAAALARRAGGEARIDLVTVVEDLPWHARLLLPNADALQSDHVSTRDAMLRRLAQPFLDEGIRIEPRVLFGRASDATIRAILAEGHDLLIKDAEPGVATTFGPADLQLARDCPCPVWILAPGANGRPPERILAPVDPSPEPDDTDMLGLKRERPAEEEKLNDTLLDLASNLARAENAALIVLHAWTAPGEGLARGTPLLAPEQIEGYVESLRAEEQKAFDRLLDRHPAAGESRSVFLVKGNAADVIAGFAQDQRADLIVLGAVARGGMPGFLIGSTAEAVLQQVDCSVLIVKPRGFVSPVAPD